MTSNLGSALNLAASSGNAEIVKELLANGATFTLVNSDGNSALHMAFINKHEEVVDLILNAIHATSIYDNLQNSMGLTHLHIACTRKNEQVIQGFLDAGANKKDTVNGDSPRWAGYNALHFAASFQSLQAVKVLLKARVDRNSKTSSGKTAKEIIYESLGDALIMVDLLDVRDLFHRERNLSNFDIACMNEDTKLVKQFIDHGAANINSKTTRELFIASLSSPLHIAVASGCKEKCELLLQNGAKVDSVNHKKMTPLHSALYGQFVLRQRGNIRKVFLEYNDQITELLYASVDDKIISHEDANGLSFFHAAISRNNLPIVKKYINESKVNVNQALPSNVGRLSNYTPLHIAVLHNSLEVAEFLIEHGADVNTSGKNQITPLHMAFEHNARYFIELFLMKGAKMDFIDPNDGNTILHLIVNLVSHSRYLADNTETENKLSSELIVMYIEQLVKLGIDVNAKNSKGNTALHCFNIWNPHWATYFQILLDLGADINLKNNQDRLPFSLEERYHLRCNKINAIFCNHVQNLKALGLKVDPENEEICQWILRIRSCCSNEELIRKEQQRLDEIAKLKNIKIGDATSLYNFIKLDTRRTKLYAGCKILKNVAEDVELKQKFPLYAYLIQLKYRIAIGYYGTKKRLHEDVEGEIAYKRPCFG